jgi:hypothetical protein
VIAAPLLQGLQTEKKKIGSRQATEAVNWRQGTGTLSVIQGLFSGQEKANNSKSSRHLIDTA